jgi:hypothetical protein
MEYSSFNGNGSKTAITTNGNNYNRAMIYRCEFNDFATAIKVTNVDKAGMLASSNFSNVSDYFIYNDNDQIIEAINNYWGTTNTTTIDAKIYDSNDDLSLAVVNYTDPPQGSAEANAGVLTAGTYYFPWKSVVYPNTGYGQTTERRFSWYELDDTASYDIQVASDAEFNTIVLTLDAITPQSTSNDEFGGTYANYNYTLATNGSYYWRIRGNKNETGEKSLWSAPNSFTLE